MSRPLRDTDDLCHNRLLSTLPEADIGLLKPWLSVLALPRSKVLFEPGDEVETTYFPCHSTMVSLLIVLRDGREVEAATIGHEGAVGGVISRGRKPAFGRAAVQIAGPAYAISTQRLEEAKQQSPRLGDVFSRYSDILAAQMMQSVACNALHSLEQRCSRWLLATHDRAGADLIHLTQESLAEMLGVQRTSVTAVARQLSEKGVIRYQRGKIEILDRPALEAESCECYEAVEAHFKAVFLKGP
ncbi:MAG: Crp/Fnr family transcriptional regulator [Caulobacterales bacterium 68-7]|nr:MAG: Crp/Fnr family transcriptional regulator [Caulobacterales bacterium 68-7]